MHYIGSKRTLAPLLLEHICKTWPDHAEWNLLDAFAGMGGFALAACPLFSSVFVNDWEEYARIILKAMFDPPTCRDLPSNVAPVLGHISNEYGPPRRMFFTEENAHVIDGYREHAKGMKDPDYMMACVLSAADKVANVATVYGAYLKQFKASANSPIDITQIPVAPKRARVTRLDARDAVLSVPTKTIVYLDPPYNHRQYGANYFPLNVIAALEDTPVQGITGLPSSGYLKSKWCSKRTAEDALKEILVSSVGSRLALSYSSDGILTKQQILDAFEETGWNQAECIEIPYKKFKAGNYEGGGEVVEYLFLTSKDFL
jgi:adenine-specific DNA-methyltransferase